MSDCPNGLQTLKIVQKIKKGKERKLTRSTYFIRFIDDSSFSDHAFCLAYSGIKILRFRNVDWGWHNDWDDILENWEQRSHSFKVSIELLDTYCLY
jgi:hypothetical protein